MQNKKQYFFSEWDIRELPDPINCRQVVATLKKGFKVRRYPFEFLRKEGMKLTLIGCDEVVARSRAYSYGKRCNRNWVITGNIIVEDEESDSLLILTRGGEWIPEPVVPEAPVQALTREEKEEKIRKYLEDKSELPLKTIVRNTLQVTLDDLRGDDRLWFYGFLKTCGWELVRAVPSVVYGKK